MQGIKTNKIYNVNDPKFNLIQIDKPLNFYHRIDFESLDGFYTHDLNFTAPVYFEPNNKRVVMELNQNQGIITKPSYLSETYGFRCKCGIQTNIEAVIGLEGLNSNTFGFKINWGYIPELGMDGYRVYLLYYGNEVYYGYQIVYQTFDLGCILTEINGQPKIKFFWGGFTTTRDYTEDWQIRSLIKITGKDLLNDGNNRYLEVGLWEILGKL